MKRAPVKIPKLEVRVSRNVFALFAALNAMGYDDENNPAGMSPLRKKVGKILGQCDWAGRYPHLQREAKIGQPWWALNAMLAKAKNIKKSSRIGRLLSELNKFSKEPAVRKLWEIFKISQVKEAKKLFPPFKGETTRLITFINRPPREVKRIVLITNSLDAHWSGYGFGVGVGFWAGAREVSYIVVGPGATENEGELIRHELLHVLAPPFRIPSSIAAVQVSKRLTIMGYGDPRILNREYIVRGLSLLYRLEVLKKDISKAVKMEKKDFPRIREAMRFVKAKINPLFIMS